MRNNLIEFRQQLGLTQEGIGKLVNKNKQYIWFVEHGKREGSADFWLLIQKKFNLSFEKIEELRIKEK